MQNSYQLISFCCAWEQRNPCIQLSYDSSQSKQVHRRIVVTSSEECFWCPVPSGGNVLREWRFSSDLPCQPIISQFDGAVVLEHVLRFHIPVKVSLPVHIRQRLQGLKGDVSDLVMRQFTLLLQQLIDVAVHVLEDEVKLVVFLDEL